MAYFIILIGSLYLAESIVIKRGKNNTQKKLKNRENFKFEIQKTSQEFDRVVIVSVRDF